MIARLPLRIRKSLFSLGVLLQLTCPVGCAGRIADPCKAADSRWNAGEWLDTSTPEDAEAALLGELDALGFRLEFRDVPRAVTLAWVVVLPERTRDWPVRDRARLLAHEVVHARQWRGIPRFARKYTTDPAFRVEAEAQATRDQVRATRAWGMSGLEDIAARLLDGLEAGYMVPSHVYDRDEISAAVYGLQCP